MPLISSSRLFQQERSASKTLQQSLRDHNNLDHFVMTISEIIKKTPKLNLQQLVQISYTVFLQQKEKLENADIIAFIDAHCAHVTQPEELHRYFEYLTALRDHFKNHAEDKEIAAAMDRILQKQLSVTSQKSGAQLSETKR